MNRILTLVLEVLVKGGTPMSDKNVQAEQSSLSFMFENMEPSAASEQAVMEPERRLAPRRKLSVPVWVRILVGNHLSPAQARQLVDISATGLGIVSKVSYEPGQTMMIELCINNTTWSGLMKVVHCSETAGGYKVGLTTVSLELDDGPEQAQSRGRRPSDAATLKQLQKEIPKAMRAYRQARASWGLLGTPIRNNIARIIANLEPDEENQQGASKRKHRRLRMKGDVHLVVPTYYGGKWLRAQILNISEGGAGLLLPFNLTPDDVERELAGNFRIAPRVPVIVGIGSLPHIIWLPAEITHCGKPENGTTRIGVAFNTPVAREAFGA